LLGLLGIALEANGDKDAAADALRRSLSSQSSIAIYLRNFANLAAVLLEAGKRDDAAEVIRESWRTPESVVQGSKESQCLAFLAEIMTALGLYSELAARLLPVVRGSELEWSTVKCVALALANLGRWEEALHLVEPVPPTYMLMYCETPADEGGDSLLASGDRLFKHLSREHPGYLAALSKPAAFTITRDDRTAKRAVFTPVNGRLRLAFRSGNDIRLEIDSKAVTAFDHVRDWLRDPANCIHYKLAAGDILIFDNTRMLHGRTAFSRESARSLHGLWCNGQSAFRDRLTSGIDPHGVCA